MIIGCASVFPLSNAKCRRRVFYGFIGVLPIFPPNFLILMSLLVSFANTNGAHCESRTNSIIVIPSVISKPQASSSTLETEENCDGWANAQECQYAMKATDLSFGIRTRKVVVLTELSSKQPNRSSRRRLMTVVGIHI